MHPSWNAHANTHTPTQTHCSPQWISDVVSYCWGRPLSRTHTLPLTLLTLHTRTCLSAQMRHAHSHAWLFDPAQMLWGILILKLYKIKIKISDRQFLFTLIFSDFFFLILLPFFLLSLRPLSSIAFASLVPMSNCSGPRREGGMERKKAEVRSRACMYGAGEEGG